jgi:hypothetical protein
MASFRNPDLKHALIKFHKLNDTPNAFQFQIFGPLPASASPYISIAGNSSFNLIGSERRIEESVLANLRPSGEMALMQGGLLHAYSQAMMKKGFSMSYILTGPVLMRPLFISGDEQLGHGMPLKTRGWGSQ